MAALPHPHAEDVIIRRESPDTFAIGVSSGTPQIICRGLEEALQRAGSFATKQHVHLWYTADGRTCEIGRDVTLLRRIWNEYVEMPALRLTREQAQRLWAVDADTCTSLLESLVDLKVLVRGPDGKYFRLTEGDETVPRLRMARAEAGARHAARTLRHVR
jgi:hypothetical protein